MLAITFYQPGTGLTRVMREILGNMPVGYDWHLIGIGYKGPIERHDHYTLYPCNLKGGDVFGVFASLEMIEKLKPKFVFLLNDFWIIRHYLRQYVTLENRPKVVAYIPLDGLIPNPELVRELIDLDACVLYTEFARREFQKSFDALSQGDRKTPQLEVIPHGVDTKTFRPLEKGKAIPSPALRSTLRKRLFPNDQEWQEDAFIILNANRPNPRKRMDLTISSFARFAQDKPSSVKLLLHHAMMTEQDREKLKRELATSGIANRVKLFPENGQPVTDEELNLIYNSCDVGINTTMGEGWGLVSMEHGATGAAQIVPDHSACAEIWQNEGLRIGIKEYLVPKFSDLKMAEIDQNSLVSQLNQLYSDRNTLEAYSRKARALANQKNFDWKQIGIRWQRLFGMV